MARPDLARFVGPRAQWRYSKLILPVLRDSEPHGVEFDDAVGSVYVRGSAMGSFGITMRKCDDSECEDPDITV